ncbi:HAD-IA family hydrolase [Streptomyces sp. NPDC047082]|uniref:HAD-IA family hydrolase n=1 Tax=Streptomyces sp. NPDC047082 TaxID=3155259 RepID=UPI0033D9821C
MTLNPPGPSHPRLEAAIFDYNGVIGLQPKRHDWQRLAALAGWPADQTADFETAFWAHREPYDADQISTYAFWAQLLYGDLSAPPGSALLDTLCRTDTEMWTRTDQAVVSVLHAAHALGLRKILLLSNAPHPLADALDRTAWCNTLMSKTLYSSRLGVNRPASKAYEAAIAAAGSDPDKTLFVDDRPENCRAAAQLGLRTLHFKGSSQVLADHLARSQPRQSGPASASSHTGQLTNAAL